MNELSTLERKRLSDLHQIASQLGIEQYRKYRKPELAQMIYKVATEQAAEQAADRQEVAVGSEPATTNGETGVTVRPTVAGRLLAGGLLGGDRVDHLGQLGLAVLAVLLDAQLRGDLVQVAQALALKGT